MRLSEAIALGRMVIEPKAGGRRNNKSGKGCALDMGMAAMYGGCWHEAYRVWPWLKKPVNQDDPEYTWMCRITYRFDCEVMGNKSLTMEKFIDWVRSVEPQEAEAPLSPTEAIAEDPVKHPQSL